MASSAHEDASLSLHHQVARRIADRIATGELAPSQRLPSERVLAQELSVSRVTLRRALHELAAAGLITSAAGRGSFVSPGQLVERPNVLMGFTELARVRGLEPAARLLGRAVRPATLDESDVFGIAPGADVLELERLRLLDGIPVAVDRSCVALVVAPALVDADFASASLYAVLDSCGAGPLRADYTIEAAAASKRHARLLELAPGGPVLVAETTAYDRDQRVVERATTVYRHDRYRFKATLIRRD